MCSGETIQLSLLSPGGGGAGRIGRRCADVETVRARLRAGMGGVCENKPSCSSVGGASTGAPGKSTTRLGVGMRAIIELAFSEVSFSAARGWLTWLSKKALNPSGIVLGEQGGESDLSLSSLEGGCFVCGETSSSSFEVLAAKWNMGELRSGSRIS